VDAATLDDDACGDAPTERFVVDLTSEDQRAVHAVGVGSEIQESAPGEAATEPAGAAQEVAGRGGSEGRLGVPDDDAVAASERPELDAAQQFVVALRAAAADFAAAAGAESVVVREAVPPARHRRAQCRLVLRYADDAEADVTFVGSAGLPGSPSRHGFDRQIRRWLEAGQRREEAWLVADPDAPDGLAVDLSAWAAAA
jgi:hypothetical protein